MCLLIYTHFTHCNIFCTVITAWSTIKTYLSQKPITILFILKEPHLVNKVTMLDASTISSSSARNSQRTQPGTRHMTSRHNIYAMFHGIFGWSFLYVRCKPSVNLIYWSAANCFYVLWSAMFYCILESKHFYFSARTSQRATKVIPSKDVNHALPSVTACKENVKIKV